MAKPGSQRNPTIESLKDRIARDPFSRAFLQLAEEYRKDAKFKEAIEVCLDGLQRHPTYHTARISLGRTYLEAGDMENARRAFTEVLELQPENHLAAKLLAEIQKKMGDVAAAAATYRGILSYYPNDREVAALLQETQSHGPVSPQAAPPAASPTLMERSAAPGAPPSAALAPAPKAPAAPAPVRAAAAVPAPHVTPASAPPPLRPGVGTRPSSDPPPDFRPEDLGVTSLAPAREPAAGLAGGAGLPWPEPRRQEEGETNDDALQTNTLAELYLRQGLVDRAMEVYRGMLRVDPENQRAARRLNELAQGSAPAGLRVGGSAAAPRAESGGARPRTAERPIAASPEIRANDVSGPRRDAIRRLERWLANIGASASKGALPR